MWSSSRLNRKQKQIRLTNRIALSHLCSPFPRRRRTATAMLQLRRSILTRLFAPPISPPHRLLSTGAPGISSNPSFAVEEYLVATCGLARAQALKASAKLSHLKSPSKPDTVLAFLAGLGLSRADVAKDPQLLCASVERTLAPIVTDLSGVGLSHTQIAGLVPLAPANFRCRSIVSDLPYCMSLFGSYDNVLRLIKRGNYLLSCDLESAVKPNVALLHECGLDNSDIAKLGLSLPWLLTAKVEHVRTMVACAEGIGVPRNSGMFRIAMHAVAFLSEEKIAAKVDYMKHTFGWSDIEVRTAVCKAPMVLAMSMEMLQSRSKFLISEMGLEPVYIAHRPAMITYSLEGRLRPRRYVVNFLKENGLLDHDWSYYTIFKVAEKIFVEKFISPHKESAPHLAEDYAAACRGKVPISFRFT